MDSCSHFSIVLLSPFKGFPSSPDLSCIISSSCLGLTYGVCSVWRALALWLVVECTHGGRVVQGLLPGPSLPHQEWQGLCPQEPAAAIRGPSQAPALAELSAPSSLLLGLRVTIADFG